MKPAAVIASILLTGCASTGSILSSEPDQIYRSASAPEAVANCLRLELAESGRSPVVLEESGGTVLLYKNSYGATDLAFTVKPEGAGSLIELRRANFPFTFSGAERCLR